MKKEPSSLMNNEFKTVYYQHQYERMEKHENYRFSISNLVFGVTTIAFTFGFSNQNAITIITGIVLPLLIITGNIFTLLYLQYTRQIIRVHRNRAQRVLEKYAPEIYKIDQEINWHESVPRRWSHAWVQSYIHGIMALLALLPMLAYLGLLSF